MRKRASRRESVHNYNAETGATEEISDKSYHGSRSPARRSPHSLRKKVNVGDDSDLTAPLSPFRRSPHSVRKKASIRCLAAYNSKAGVDDKGRDDGSSTKSPRTRSTDRKTHDSKEGVVSRSVHRRRSKNDKLDGNTSIRSSFRGEDLPEKPNLKSSRGFARSRPHHTASPKRRHSPKRGHSPKESGKRPALQQRNSMIAKVNNSSSPKTKPSEKRHGARRRNSMVANMNNSTSSAPELSSRSRLARSASMNARSIKRTPSSRGESRLNAVRNKEQSQKNIQKSTS